MWDLGKSNPQRDFLFPIMTSNPREFAANFSMNNLPLNNYILNGLLLGTYSLENSILFVKSVMLTNLVNTATNHNDSYEEWEFALPQIEKIECLKKESYKNDLDLNLPKISKEMCKSTVPYIYLKCLKEYNQIRNSDDKSQVRLDGGKKGTHNIPILLSKDEEANLCTGENTKFVFKETYEDSNNFNMPSSKNNDAQNNKIDIKIPIENFLSYSQHYIYSDYKEDSNLTMRSESRHTAKSKRLFLPFNSKVIDHIIHNKEYYLKY